VTLPNEVEWEKAARGEYGNFWPWGNIFKPQHCNSNEGGKNDTTPVGSYSPAGDSPFGLADMAGNVWEWTRSLHRDYPYDVGDGREDLTILQERAVVRGGSFYGSDLIVRCAFRLRLNPDNRGDDLGFRVVLSR
jgi:formylglycine-generating enzyme required for sulfatase activity